MEGNQIDHDSNKMDGIFKQNLILCSSWQKIVFIYLSVEELLFPTTTEKTRETFVYWFIGVIDQNHWTVSVEHFYMYDLMIFKLFPQPGTHFNGQMGSCYYQSWNIHWFHSLPVMKGQWICPCLSTGRTYEGWSQRLLHALNKGWSSRDYISVIQ